MKDYVEILKGIMVFNPTFNNTPVSSTNITDHHAITEILLKVALNIITLTPTPSRVNVFR
jgi:hypothetical protein